MAAEPVARDDQGAFWAGMQRAHASQVVAQKQALVGENPGTYRTRQPPKACKWSSSKRQEQACQMRAEGYAVFTEDEAAIQTQQNPNYGWRPTGGRETSKTTFSTRSIRMFGAMSKDRLLIKAVDSANSETFQEFLEEIRRDHPKFYMVLDNASCHKSKTIREYVESAGDDIALEFLPPYTPQLNPIETAWRDLKRRLARQTFPVY